MTVITGQNGYVGTALRAWLEKDGYEVRRVGVRGETDENIFENADVVIHTAGIVHNKKADDALYDAVNTALTKKLALLAKNSGVRHFIFFSTMAVYGMTEGRIDRQTVPSPKNGYGKSKLAAEKLLLEMQTDDFKVTILRSPMVYGRGCPGNYALLSGLCKKVHIFPDVKNKRSLIYIGNLCDCVERVIKDGITGIIHPQNAEYVNTADMCRYIAAYSGKKVFFSRLLGAVVPHLGISVAKKAFGSLYYADDTAFLCDRYGLEESIRLTETGSLSGQNDNF